MDKSPPIPQNRPKLRSSCSKLGCTNALRVALSEEFTGDRKEAVPFCRNRRCSCLEVHAEVSMPDKVAQGVEEGAVVRIATVARL